VHGWTALEVSAYLTIFNFPWIIKSPVKNSEAIDPSR
jgi:hypothetical protein